MKNAKLKHLSFALVLALGGLYSTMAASHGFVESPMSRSFYYYSNGNPNIVWPADEIEAYKLPVGGTMDGDNPFENKFDFPPDGKLASGGNPSRSAMDNESYSWRMNPMKAGKQQFKWLLAAPHRTTYFTYYITKQDWKSKPGYGQRLTKDMFEDKPFCHDIWATSKPLPPRHLVQTCDVPQRTGEQKIYAVWRIRDTAMAFYQMIDVDFGKDDDGDVIQKPTASVTVSSDILSTSRLTLDGSASTGKDLKYSWTVLNHSDKVILEGSESSKASIRLKSEPDSDFSVNVKLTVTGAGDKSDSQTITLKAKAVVDSTLPVAVAGKDFKVVSKNVSAGYDLNGLASKNAEKFKWTIVSGADTFWLQKENASPWVKEVDQATARALIPANTTGKVTYRLTVTSKNGKTDSSDITVEVSKESPPLPDKNSWDRNTTYDKPCQKVTYKGSTWLNGWWSRANEPGADGDHGIWRKEGSANMHSACK